MKDYWERWKERLEKVAKRVIERMRDFMVRVLVFGWGVMVVLWG
ncbi:hypothetical protein [Siminovitchia fortis]|nr:hypothetical protein [Siminovitchia fortis]